MRFFTALLAFTFYGCTADTMKRTTYEAVQNIQQQQCQKNISTECEPRQSYDKYQQKLKSVQ